VSGTAQLVIRSGKLTGLSVTEILQRGRAKVARASSCAINSAWAPAQPAPARIVILFERFSTSARSPISSSEGRTVGFGSEKRGLVPDSTASFKAISPGIERC